MLEGTVQSISSSKRKFSFREACNYSSSAGSLTPAHKALVSTFLLTFFFVVGSWLLPEWTPSKSSITNYTGPVMFLTGWTQYWSLFCPEVRDINYDLSALVEFSDGTIKYYEFPRMQKLDLLTKFKREKLRKLFGDNISWPNYAQFRPSICRYLARANNDPNNPPERVTMLWNSINTPPPDKATFCYRDELPPHTNKAILFSYKVNPDDLK